MLNMKSTDYLLSAESLKINYLIEINGFTIFNPIKNVYMVIKIINYLRIGMINDCIKISYVFLIEFMCKLDSVYLKFFIKSVSKCSLIVRNKIVAL